MPSFYPEGNASKPSDNSMRSLHKLVDLANGGLTSSGGTGGGSAGRYGSGSPEGVVTAPQGTTYARTDTGGFWTKNTGSGSTGWVEIVA